MKKFVKENINEWEGPESGGMSRSFKRDDSGDYQYSDSARIAREIEKMNIDDSMDIWIKKEGDNYFKWKKEFN